MIVYRITKRKYANDISGTGAAFYPGRWNIKGTPVLYTGATKEIALLETIAHAPPFLTPNLDLLTLEIPDHSISQIHVDELPETWFHYPAPSYLSEIGQEWIAMGETISLIVPSAIIHTSNNVILNCNHKDYHLVKVLDQTNFHFDSRLVK